MMIAFVFAAVLAAAAADPAAKAATTPVKADKAKKEELVCKKEAVLGSRMKQRVCMTQAEWDQRRADSRSELEKSQSTKPLAF